jgi:2',3'-cyclic-nucleotide 2'-phosphodiesterase/3'-nucleotidase/5'-nucleotidase
VQQKKFLLVNTNYMDISNNSEFIEKDDTLLDTATTVPVPSKTISLTPLSTNETGIFDAGAAEITAYDPKSQRLFTVNAETPAVDIIDISDPTNLVKIDSIDVETFGGVANSVSVFDGVVALAIENEDPQKPGNVVFLDSDGNLLADVEVGALPDALTFTPDGKKVLVANEGEPNEEYTIDPEGSVSIIDVSEGFTNLTQEHVTTADFTDFNNQKKELIEAGVRIFGPNANVAQDMEPEYIAVSSDSSTAWIALQENNALGVLDIHSGEITEILPLGYKDHSLKGNGIDASDEDGKINIVNWPVFGMYQPDGMATYEVNGETYIVTANEGDARDYDGYSEEVRLADLDLDRQAFPNADELQADKALGRLTVTTANGDLDGDGKYEEIYAYGGRSFAIWTADGELVYDSGDDFEQITAAQFPENFNSNNTENNSFDTRSDNKGPEPEDIAIGEIDGRTYAFIGLERISGIMIYDLTDPTQPEFVDYVNNRDFSVEFDPDAAESGESDAWQAAGDLGTEGVIFIAAEDSPNGKPLVVTANEVSGTTTVFEITVAKDDAEKSVGELIFGSENKDEIEADTGDTLFAGADNDILDASAGSGGNRLYGSIGNDTLFAGNNDRLFGGEGKDILFAGINANTLTGGADADQFWIAYNGLPESTNTITDFEIGTDVLGVAGLSEVNSFDDLNISQSEDNIVISVLDRDLVILKGIEAATLDSNSFLFA